MFSFKGALLGSSLRMDTLLTAKAALMAVLPQGPGYGAELIERVARRTEGRLRLAKGAVYPALHAMENQGLVRGREAPLPAGLKGGPRRLYRLTAKGEREAFEQQRTLLNLYEMELSL